MTQRNLRNIIIFSLLIWLALAATITFAALYNITGTKNYVNGLPTRLTAAERAKLVTVTAQSQTDAACVQPCTLLSKNDARARIKQIIIDETPKPTCPQFTTGTPPACVPIPCGQGFTGNQPNCTPIVVPPVTSLMPIVDTTKNIAPAAGFSDLRIRTTGQQPEAPGDIAFRIFCGISHMNNDDPMLFPNQKDATHHHTFFGNTSVKFDSDLNNLSSVGNSTCWGGTMNRSAYWHPSMIDANGVAMPPNDSNGNGNGVLFYYKAGFDGVKPEDIKPAPKGLRMFTGNSKAKTADEVMDTKYHCLNHSTGTDYLTNSKSIPNCGVGHSVTMQVSFPRCWDGKNLDSPNHRDHMSHAVNGSCPASHPVAIPQITFNMRWKVTKPNEALTWRLSSDNYAFNGSNGGYSAHADYVEGWQEGFMATIVKNCLNAKKDCGGDKLGDGRVIY